MERIRFCRLTEDDLYVMHRWLNTEHVMRYYSPGGRTLGATSCVIGPEVNNTAAIRAYEKAGFRYWKTVDVPGEPAPEHLLRIDR